MIRVHSLTETTSDNVNSRIENGVFVVASSSAISTMCRFLLFIKWHSGWCISYKSISGGMCDDGTQQICIRMNTRRRISVCSNYYLFTVRKKLRKKGTRAYVEAMTKTQLKRLAHRATHISRSKSKPNGRACFVGKQQKRTQNCVYLYFSTRNIVTNESDWIDGDCACACMHRLWG